MRTMKPEPAAAPTAAHISGSAAGALREQRYASGLLLIVLCWVLAWYWDTARSMAAIWQRSDTFAHGYLIAPISAWLIWRSRQDLAALSLRPDFRMLLLLAATGFGWLLGQLAGVDVVQQYCLVLMIPLLVWTLVGGQIVRALAFPLFFLLFAVPFGEFMEPKLMEHTADFTVFALRLTGVPVYREGQLLMLPTGNWSVVEACSGLRYLIASLTLSFLYAYLTYRSYSRRAIFIVASVVVPVVANWLRAYMIVMIGHLSGMKYAVGVDHLIYGWLFFGLVMLLLFWVGSFWREDIEQPGSPARTGPAGSAGMTSLRMIVAAAAAAAMTAALWPLAATRIEASGNVAAPALQAPSSVAGWQSVDGKLVTWNPLFQNSRAQFTQTYAKGAATVGLYVGYYRNQGQGAKLITSQNSLIGSNNIEWRSLGEGHRSLTLNNEKLTLIEADLRGQSDNLVVWYWYWVDGEYTVNRYWGKLLQAKSTLFGRGDDGAVIIIYTKRGADGADASATLQDFGSSMLPGITRALNNAR